MDVTIQPVDAIKSMLATCIKINSARPNRFGFDCWIGVSLGFDVKSSAYPTKSKTDAATKNIMPSQAMAIAIFAK